MTEQSVKFFSKDSTKAELQRLMALLPTRESDKGIDRCAPYLKQIIRSMISAPAAFDEHCQVNIEWIGDTFYSSIREFTPDQENSREALINIFTMAYRFLCELQFSIPDNLTPELRQVISYVQESFDDFSGRNRSQLVFASFTMPVEIAKKLINHPDILSIRQLAQDQISAPKLKKQWDEELTGREQRVEALKTILDGLETGYNFVGLAHGFKDLVGRKKSEEKTAFWCLLLLGFLVIAPLIFEVGLILKYETSFSKYKEFALYIIPPALALELVLIYFFRVVLLHFRSIKAQLLQLELRTALCQFIQSYSNYSSDIKKANSTALEKFENLIFSGLLANEDKLPATFDGADQLIKIFKSARGG
ncbi:UNVERIFIED_ORG: hypothetical protein LHJ69_08805 [Shinella sp. XGS7]|nr:hypothetical protein [Shinella sp. XGS7]